MKLEEVRGSGAVVDMEEEFRLLTLQVIGEAVLSLPAEECDRVSAAGSGSGFFPLPAEELDWAGSLHALREFIFRAEPCSRDTLAPRTAHSV